MTSQYKVRIKLPPPMRAHARVAGREILGNVNDVNLKVAGGYPDGGTPYTMGGIETYRACVAGETF